MHPEKTSQYTCSAAGIPIFTKIGSIPYHSPIIITPESMFANRRSEMEIAFANSPITLIGNRIGRG